MGDFPQELSGQSPLIDPESDEGLALDQPILI